MKRPSHYVLPFALLLMTVFVLTGDLTLRQPPEPVEPRPVVLRLDPPDRPVATGTVVGRVLDTLGFDIAGARVAAGQSRADTAADGVFRLDVPLCAAIDLRVATDGHRGLRLRAYPAAGESLLAALEPAAPWDPVVSTPDRSGRVDVPLMGEGFVHDDAGRAMADALVVVAETGAMARTNAAGRYEVPLKDGPNTLLVHRPLGGADDLGFAGRAEPFVPERATGRVPLPDLRVAAAVALRGTVRDGDGRPQPGAPLQVEGQGLRRTIAAGKGGVFRLAGLLPGAYELRALAFRGSLGRSIAVSLEAPVTDCELHLRAAKPRRLRVVTPGGDPVARAILATSVDGVRREVAHTDGEGWVQVQAAEPSARYEVRSGADYRPWRVVSPPEDADTLVVAPL